MNYVAGISNHTASRSTYNSNITNQTKFSLPSVFYVRDAANGQLQEFDISVDIYDINEIKDIVKTRLGVTEQNNRLSLRGIKDGLQRPITNDDSAEFKNIVENSKGRLIFLVCGVGNAPSPLPRGVGKKLFS